MCKQLLLSQVSGTILTAYLLHAVVGIIFPFMAFAGHGDIRAS